MSGWSRDAFRQRLLGEHPPVGQRHFVRLRGKSAPANAQVPCSHFGASWSPRLTAGSLAEGDDRSAAALLASLVDRADVVALVERGRLRGEAARLDRREQLGDGGRLMCLRRLHRPRDRKIGLAARGHVELVPIEPTALPGRHRGAVTPRGVRVREALPLGAVLREVALTVRVGWPRGDSDRPGRRFRVDVRASGTAWNGFSRMFGEGADPSSLI